MRWLLAGVFLLASSAAVFAQATGEVEAIGFGGSEGYFRPDCWTPMLIRLTSTTDQPHSYVVKILQEDLDRDMVSYSQQIELGGSQEGQTTTEKYWVYFRPRAVRDSLPSGSRNDLAKVLQVNLCDAKKPDSVICQLKITSSVNNIDTNRAMMQATRSQRLILCVSDTGERASADDFDDATLGLEQNVIMLPVSTDDLPDDVIGYESVDGVVWLDGDANRLTQGTRIGSLEALESYVRLGGTLVVSQNADVTKTQPFAPLLPVQTQNAAGVYAMPAEDCKTLDTLQRIANLTAASQPWLTDGGPFKVARALPTSDAVVDEWQDWTGYAAGPPRTPYLARRGVGLGSVIWVAQDLGDLAIRRAARSHWAQIWERVMGWKDRVVLPDEAATSDDRQKMLDQWNAVGSVDLGKSIFSGLEIDSKTVTLVSVAVLFFIVYWFIAGPGLFMFLRYRRQAEMNWFAFGLLAFVATALTVLLVHIVLRGAPELRHLSIVRVAANEPAEVQCRFGLYIPRDGNQQIDLQSAVNQPASYILPLAWHPENISDDAGFTVSADYDVPIHKADGGNGVSDIAGIAPYYRSTLKKFEATWVGARPESIGGSVKLLPAPKYLSGTLVNNSGHDLMHVFLAFRHPGAVVGPTDATTAEYDWGIALAKWANGASIDLGLLMNTKDPNGGRQLGGEAKIDPWGKTPIFGLFNVGDNWSRRWLKSFPSDDAVAGDAEDAILAMSFLTRLTPQTNEGGNNRVEVYNRGGRRIDLSGALASGKLVIVAFADDVPVPLPLSVDGESVTGDGTNVYQFVLPVDRSAVEPMPAANGPNAASIAAPAAATASTPTGKNASDINEFNKTINNAIQNGSQLHPD